MSLTLRRRVYGNRGFYSGTCTSRAARRFSPVILSWPLQGASELLWLAAVLPGTLASSEVRASEAEHETLTSSSLRTEQRAAAKFFRGAF